MQVNVSIRYLSFARKTFSTGLFLLNTMTRNVHREIKECVCLYFSSDYLFQDGEIVLLLFGEYGFPKGP